MRVLIDGIGSGYFRCPAYGRLHRNRVPVARFMHSGVPWRMPFLNLRSHKKILVIDGRVGFTGGMNIAAQNVLATNPKEPVRDTHFRFRGPVVEQLTDAFARDWLFATDEELDGEAWYPDLDACGDAVARVVTSGPDQDLEKIELVLLQAIAGARDTIRLMTPYFLPDERLVTALALAAMRGVEVNVIVPEKSDHPLGRLGDARQCRPAAGGWLPHLAQPAAVRAFQDAGGRRHLVPDRQRQLGHAQSSPQFRTQRSRCTTTIWRRGWRISCGPSRSSG